MAKGDRSRGEGAAKQVEESSPAPTVAKAPPRSLGGLLRLVQKALLYRHQTFPYAKDEEGGGLPMRVKLSFGLPMFAVTSLTMLINIHGTAFFTSIGANVTYIAFFTAIARSIDVITDPLMGWISDSTRTVFGRRRPYMAIGCVFYALFFALLFSPPKEINLVAWFGVFYIAFYLCVTLSDVPHGALGPELTDDSEERNSLYFWYNIFRAIGILVAATAPVALPIYLQRSLDECRCGAECIPSEPQGGLPLSAFNETACGPPPGGELGVYCGCLERCDNTCNLESKRLGFSHIAVFFGAYYILSMWNCVGQIRERSASLAKPTPPIVPSLLMTFRNKPFVGLLPAWVCDMTAITMLGTMMPFYVPYVIQPESVPECADGKRAVLGLDDMFDKKYKMFCQWETWLGVGLVMLFLANAASMPLWLAITKKLGKVKTWLLFNLTTAFTNGLFIFAGKGDPKLATSLAVLNGIPSGAQFLTDSILADVIDYDEFLTGQRSEGRFTIFQGFIPKIVSVPAQAIPLAVLSAVGFVEPINGRIQPQSATVRTYISAVFFVVPFILSVISFLIKRKYPIKNQELTDKIAEGIGLHMKGMSALDPLTGQSNSLFQFTPGKEDEETRLSWDLDHFFMSQLDRFSEQAKSGGVGFAANYLAGRMMRNVIYAALTGLLCAIVVAVSMVVPVHRGNTLVETAAMSWLPVFSVIGLSMSLSLGLFHFVRYEAALRLKGMFADRKMDFFNRWLRHLHGEEASDAVNARVSTVNIKTLVKAINVASRGAGSSGAAREDSVDNLRLSGLSRPLPQGSVRNLSSRVIPEADDEDDEGGDGDRKGNGGDRGGGSGESRGVEVELAESKPTGGEGPRRRRWHVADEDTAEASRGESASGEAGTGTGAGRGTELASRVGSDGGHRMLVHDSSMSETSFKGDST